MSGELSPRIVGKPAAIGRLSRPLARRVSVVEEDAVVASARVSAAAYLTHVAATYIAGLSEEEATLIARSPLAEPRLKAVVDHFAAVACNEIARMGW